MRRASLLLLALVPLTGAAQIILPPLPAKQRAELEACIKAEGNDAHALQVCTQRMDEASKRGGKAPPPTEPAPATRPVPTPTEQPAVTPPSAPEPAPPPAAANEETQAEKDYDAIYGTEEYNPVADSTLPQPAQLPVSYDPWEKMNRKVHTFNNGVDRHIAKPLAKAYVAVVPRTARLGVSNFFNNLSQPVSALNALLQGRPKQAAQSLGRFAMNTTLGIGGLFDPATDAHLPNHGEDFGQTLGVWGWKRSRYLELPLFGPRTLRDVLGMAGDAPLAPLPQIEDDKLRVFLQGLQLVDIRTQLFAVDSMREGATDDYTLVRDAWLQRRNYQINGDRDTSKPDELPDYLRDDNGTEPNVPVDAMPVPPNVR